MLELLIFYSNKLPLFKVSLRKGQDFTCKIYLLKVVKIIVFSTYDLRFRFHFLSPINNVDFYQDNLARIFQHCLGVLGGSTN